jgi:quercetin dioxygenase-like cupin family protein
MITVVADSTVSRTALKAQGVRVVLFACDAGQELTEHTAAMPVLLQVVSGRVRVGAAGDLVDLESGSLIHLTARLPHTVLALEPSKLQLTMLDQRST